MGAQQAFQWAVSYPDFMDGIVGTSGTAKTYGHGIVRLEGEIAALTADAGFNGGEYDRQPEKGIQAFAIGADANDLVLQMRTWEKHDVGNSPPFHGDVEAALRSIKARVLYMPSQTDLYFPVSGARYEAVVIPSLWGHPAGAGASPADGRFLNQHIADFLEGKVINWRLRITLVHPHRLAV